jgi:hypothetical protein
MFVIIDFAGSYEPLHQLLLTLFWFIAHECSYSCVIGVLFMCYYVLFMCYWCVIHVLFMCY